MKPSSKNKRKRSEIEDTKQEEKQLIADKYGYLKEVKKLKKEREDSYAERTNLKECEKMMENLCK